MPVMRTTGSALVLCALLLVGCRGTTSQCPEATVTVDPQEIPEGANQTDVLVDVNNPSPDNGLVVITELAALTGTFANPFARETTFACDHDFSGPVEICVTTTYAEGDGGASEDPSVGASSEYLRLPHVRISDPLECSDTRCTTVVCPEEKNVCPVVSSLTVEPRVVPEEGMATIEVVAEDPDDNPEALVTTLLTRHGTIKDPNASQAIYTCDSNVGGAIEICVIASDGDPSCDDKLCTWVRCPGEPLENTCPIVEDLSATPMMIPPGETLTLVRVDATDPDESPEPLRTELIAASGAFQDRFASEAVFRCGEPGPVEICVEARDGDPMCDEAEPTCITVQCPSDVPINVCPMLFIINTIPSTIREGQTTTMVETRAQDTDGVPVPLALTLSALWGSFENTANIQEPFNVVAQNATYICALPGQVELCVEASDGACTKTLCTNVTCPEDVPTPP